ncbi:MAG: M20 family metallo-hydrolase [Sediminibacterium sp.]|nr:M20 family metallo-hydrolase [Sediminibacterium sp.]
MESLILKEEALELLKQIISIPSLSTAEDNVAQHLNDFFENKNINCNRKNNNIWVKNKFIKDNKPTILLNSHIDTVKPNNGYTNNPFQAFVKDGKLYGLGSNDAGGALVSLIASFLYFYQQDNLNYNFIFAATAEEEISGTNGIKSILPELGLIDFAIVGEPTEMNLAIAERGLLVLDCIAHGTASHAAHFNHDNPILHALHDIQWVSEYQFAKNSDLLGPVKMTVTIINGGTQHNVIPATCNFTIDVRSNEFYSNQEIFNFIKQHLKSEVKPRSLHLNASAISEKHCFVNAGKELGRTIYGSPTTSDKALMNFDAVKIGPGDSTRSHSSDEFIYIDEIYNGIELYIKMLSKIIYNGQ